MSWVTGLLVYVMIWWVLFFMALPFGVRLEDEPEVGHATSAPRNPMLWRKALVTTLIAGVLWGVFYYVVSEGLISLDSLPG